MMMSMMMIMMSLMIVVIINDGDDDMDVTIIDDEYDVNASNRVISYLLYEPTNA